MESLLKELEDTKVRLGAARLELRNLRDSLQDALSDWAATHMRGDESAYDDLSELLRDNGLEGLSRAYRVTVDVSWSFEVEVQATSPDAAQDDVEENLADHISENIDINYPDNVDLDVNMA